MNREIQSRQINLSQRPKGHIDVLGTNHTVQLVVRKRLARFVVVRESFQNELLPHPIFEHLTGGFHEIAGTLGEAGGIANAFAAESVHNVACQSDVQINKIKWYSIGMSVRGWLIQENNKKTTTNIHKHDTTDSTYQIREKR